MAFLPCYTGAVVLSLTRGEIILIAFVFALTYGALVLPRWAESLGKRMAGGAGKQNRSKE